MHLTLAITDCKNVGVFQPMLWQKEFLKNTRKVVGTLARAEEIDFLVTYKGLSKGSQLIRFAKLEMWAVKTIQEIQTTQVIHPPLLRTSVLAQFVLPPLL